MTALRKPDDTRLVVQTECANDFGRKYIDENRTTWGEFRKANRDDIDAIRDAYLVVLGVKRSVTLGGGASPMVTVTRAET